MVVYLTGAHNLVPPVGTLSGSLDFLRCEPMSGKWSHRGGVRIAIGEYPAVAHPPLSQYLIRLNHVVLGVIYFDWFIYILAGDASVVAQLQTVAPSFGGNQHHPVGRPGTVDGRGGSIF